MLVAAATVAPERARADGTERVLRMAADVSFWVVGLFAVVATILAIRFIRTVLSERAVSRVVAWVVEFEGRPVGTVEGPERDDMFWSVWRVVPSCQENAIVLTSKENWDQGRFAFRDLRTGQLGSSFCGGLTPTPEDMRVALRWFHWERDQPPRKRA